MIPAPIPRAQAEDQWSIETARELLDALLQLPPSFAKPDDEQLKRVAHKIAAHINARQAPLQAQNARLRAALEIANDTLRNIEALLITMDSDERYRAREENRSAIVHTNDIKHIKVAREAARQTLAAPQEDKP